MKLLILLCILSISSTSEGFGKRETINSMSYTTGDGGKGGGFSRLTIAKDFSVLEIEQANSRRFFRAITDPLLWEKLTATNLNEFDKIVSSERTAPHDGTDTEVTIVTDVKKHFFVNGQYQNSKEILLLVALLEQQKSIIATPENRQPDDFKAIKEEQIIYSIATVDVQPSFPAGIAKFYEHVSKSLHLNPDEFSGQIILSFIVEVDGSLTDVKITKGNLRDKNNRKVVQLIRNCPKWNPGEKNGKKVRTFISVRIRIN